MSAEDFFSRWAKKNEEARADQAAMPAPEKAPAPPDPYEGRAPTQEDLDKLTPQDDLSPFMKQGVDENVKRSALRKLFSDPHFNIMDGLDIYIDDYSKPDPIPPEMMAMLLHAKGLLDPDGLKPQPVAAMRSEADVLPGDKTAAEQSDETPPPVSPDPKDAAVTSVAGDAQDTGLAAPAPQTQQAPPHEPGQKPAHPPAASSAAPHDTSGTDPETEMPQP